VINASLSDHDIIACIRKFHNIKYEAEIITCRDCSKYNVNDINNDLLRANWDPIYTSTCPVYAFNIIKTILTDTLNRHAPYITKRVKGNPSPWSTVAVKRHMNVRDQLKRKAKKSNKQSD